MSSNLNVYAFDLSSNFSRVYFKSKKQGIPADGFSGTLPVFVLKPLLFQVFKEIRSLTELVGPPTHLLLVLDHEDSTFREEIYPEYKANRPIKESDYNIQKKLVEYAFEYMKIALIKKRGVEADDVLATVATKCSLMKIPLTICTKDKDLFALVDDSTRIYSGQEDKLFNADEVLQAKGLPPSKITDMLILQGDKVDNIPGISGVGLKISRDILSQFSLQDVLLHPDILLDTKIRGRKGIVADIKANGARTALMTKVATMLTDVDLDTNMSLWCAVRLPVERSKINSLVYSAFYYAVEKYRINHPEI